MARYVVSRGRVVVTARSSIHDTTCVWSEVSGTIDYDPDHPEKAQADVKVDMRTFDAGDRLKNWKLKGDIQPDKYPEAVFRLGRLENVSREGDRLRAGATGVLAWRNRETDLRAEGGATVTPQKIEATAQFELDVRRVGVEPPKILLFKVEETVLVEVELTANALLS